LAANQPDLREKYKIHSKNRRKNGEKCMLIISRRLNEAFYIGNDIKVVILELRGSQVRIGIEAPKDKIIRRGEIPPNGANKEQQEKEDKGAAPI
jgi:carbon storage regulator